MATSSCLSCFYLTKKPSARGFFIYKCSYWGLTTQNILPQTVIISSIGKKCPFYKVKEILNKNKIKKKNETNNNFDITI